MNPRENESCNQDPDKPIIFSEFGAIPSNFQFGLIKTLRYNQIRKGQ